MCGIREDILKVKINKKREELNKILSTDIFNRNYAQKTSEDLDDLIIRYYKDETRMDA
ncbi:Spo0E family sporulation regulatory protein-aspartic acid phosphatase [Clostridium sp. D2Q-14]|uniref:Spo0E family sporulation regulatory protein-aspartic acid phosphatase n=1 Tax=Anaeromonas gelatinilytica TaxID=2683194 RepID=UPI00193C53D1|nr:Spo0E family sporulation regulatory protein-aspartic acid phosphatase [Anaeromonas gelatinilytica]MBS4534586.1 Spo0E family sporulation regulatory protein-aspartic acid phosphatase [Anaeromonas gelatinilytica]